MPANKHTQESTSATHAVKKHVPLRRCVLCRSSKPQAELIRFYKTDSGSWQLDTFHLAKLGSLTKLSKPAKPSGRGAWVCRDNSCHKQKRLEYFFKKQAADIGKQLVQVTQLIQSTQNANEHKSTGANLPKETENTKFHSGGMNV